MGLLSRGTRGFTQSRNGWVYTVRNALVYTVAERLGLHSRETPGFTQ